MIKKIIRKIINPLNLELNPVNLHFQNKRLEIEFSNDFKEKNLTLTILFALLSAFIFLLFYIIYDMEHPAWFIIMIGLSVAFGLVIYLKLFRKFQVVALFVFSLVVEMSYNHRMLFYYGKDTAGLAEYFLGLMLIVLAVNSFIKLKFVLAVILNSIFLFAFLAYSIFGIEVHTLNPEYFSYSSILFLSIVVVVCISIYNNEYMYRNAFIQHKIIKLQANELKEAKENMEQKVIERTYELEQERSKKVKAIIEGQQIERQRIAQDLHDSLNIRLIVLKRSVESSCANENTEILKEIDGIVNQVREISHNLLPYSLKHYGLIKAIEDLCVKLNNENQINADFSKIDVQENKRWDTIIENELFKIIQELTANCIKHAKATQMFIELIDDKKMLYLTVEDNGIGFNYDNTSKNNFGLNNINARISLLGGTISYDSQINKGTTVMINIPII